VISSWRTDQVMGLCVAATATLIVSGCATVTPAPGAEAVKVTKNPADVTACRAMGNVDSRAAHGNVLNITPVLRNQVIGLGGDTLLLTFDPRDHVVSNPGDLATGIAYKCEVAPPVG